MPVENEEVSKALGRLQAIDEFEVSLLYRFPRYQSQIHMRMPDALLLERNKILAFLSEEGIRHPYLKERGKRIERALNGPDRVKIRR